MASLSIAWLTLLLCCSSLVSLPLPADQDSDESRKVLGSSVVTSVSVLQESGDNSTATPYHALADAGRPDAVGSPVAMLTPDRYQFYTFDGEGNLVKRFMTPAEVKSIIANGQKQGGDAAAAATAQPPTFYHGEAGVAQTHDAPSAQASAQLKMHHVVERVQDVLKTQLAQVAQVAQVAADPAASWSHILPGFLGDVEEPLLLEDAGSGQADTTTPRVTEGHTTPEELEELEEETEETVDTEDITEAGEKIADPSTSVTVTRIEEKTEEPLASEEMTEIGEKAVETITSDIFNETEEVTEFSSTTEEETGSGEVIEESTSQPGVTELQGGVTAAEVEVLGSTVPALPTAEDLTSAEEATYTDSQPMLNDQPASSYSEEDSDEEASSEEKVGVPETLIGGQSESSESPGIPTETQKLPVIATAIPEIIHDPKVISKVPETSTKTSELPKNSTETSELPKTPTETSELPKTPTETSELPETATESQELPETATESQELPETSTESQELPETSTETTDLLETSTEMGEIPETKTQILELSHKRTETPVITKSTTETSEITDNPTEVTNNPTKITDNPTKITDNPTEISNIPTEIPDVPEISKEAGDSSTATDVTDESETTTELLLADAPFDDVSKESLASDSASAAASSASVSEDKSADNMVDTTSNASGEVHHPSDALGHDTDADANFDADVDADAETGVAQLQQLNVTRDLGSALSHVLGQVFQEALDDEGGAERFETSVSSSQSAHSTSASVTSSHPPALPPLPDAGAVEKLNPVEVVAVADGDTQAHNLHNKRHNQPDAGADAGYQRVPLITSVPLVDAATPPTPPKLRDDVTLDASIPISDEEASAETPTPTSTSKEDGADDAGSGSGSGSGDDDDTQNSVEGETTPEGSGDLPLDVNEYAQSNMDAGVTTPMQEGDADGGEGAVSLDVMAYAAGDIDVGVTTPSPASVDEQNDAVQDSTDADADLDESTEYDVNKYAASDTDLGVTTPGDADSATSSGENSSMFDVNKYAASDTDLGVTTPGVAAADISAEYIVDVDEDVGSATTPSSRETDADLYDVNKYVNSDADLGLTTPMADADAATTPTDLDLLMNDAPADDVEQLTFKSAAMLTDRTNWTEVATVSAAAHTAAHGAEHGAAHGALQLRPAPQESLGLEASTASLVADVQRFTELCNELAFKLWRAATPRAGASVALAPFAVTSLLSMIFLGAKGLTSGQMNDVLRLDDMMTFNPHQVFRNVTDSLVLHSNAGVSTAAFVRQLYSDKGKGRMLDFYKQRASEFYEGHVEEVDFAEIGDTVRRRTNMLVKKQTGGRVGELMRDATLKLQPPLAAFSANVFQSDCSAASTAGRDGEMYFTVLPASRHRRLVPVPAAVFRSGFLAGYEPRLDVTAVSLGDQHDAVSTLLLLPGQQGQLAPGDGLPLLEDRLFDVAYSDGAWSRLLRSLQPRAGLEVQIPRFALRSELNVTRALRAMGLDDLFDPAHADLKGLSGAGGLHVSDVVQVNAFGTCGQPGAATGAAGAAGAAGASHHVEVFPVSQRRARMDTSQEAAGAWAAAAGAAGVEDVDSVYKMPLALRPRQAREPEPAAARLKFDRPFLYVVRHNPTGFLLFIGRFSPRLLN